MKFIVEISNYSVSTCKMNGEEIGKSLRLYSDLEDCSKSGDCQEACEYVLKNHKPEFRTVVMVDGEYENVIATAAHKQAVCESIYYDSNSDFSDEDTANMYLIWEASSQLE